jgi:hypothetical protein
MRKLNDAQVAEIEKLLKTKKAHTIARELGIHARIISEIRDGIYVNKTKPKQSKESRDYPGHKQQRVLTPAQVREIRTKLQANEAPSRIAKQYKVHPDTIRRIANNESYRDVR